MDFETNRLILRKYTENDLMNYFNLRSNELVWNYSSKKPLKDLEKVNTELNNLLETYKQTDYQFHALFLKDSMTYIGEAGILAYHPQNNRAVIGYNILPQYWNKGYATEISGTLLNHLFKNLHVHRVEALVIEENKASKRVLEKLGFQLEGLLRHFAYINGIYLNVCYYGIIQDE